MEIAQQQLIVELIRVLYSNNCFIRAMVNETFSHEFPTNLETETSLGGDHYKQEL